MLKIILIITILLIKVQTGVFCDSVDEAEKILNEVSKDNASDSLEDSNESVKEKSKPYVGILINALVMYIYLSSVCNFNNDLFWIIKWLWS